MSDSVQVIQFPHPGGEHNAKENVGGIMPWNTGSHARKFLARHGTYLTSLGDPLAEGELGFWGEWEPPSAVTPLRARKDGEHPRWLHRVEPIPPAAFHRQNTDPCVLGGFWYTNCRQLNTDHRTPHPRMQSLAAGSLILFGSRRDGGWVLDTVFVVAWHQPYSFGQRPDVPAHVRASVIDPLYSGDKRYSGFRAYSGATHADPVDGMFSFVPSKPLSTSPLGFERPHIARELGLNSNVARTASLIATGRDEAQRVWRVVADLVVDAGLVLGVSLEAPTTSTEPPPARPRTGRTPESAERSGRGRPC